jgi:hypothetical protein
VLATCVAAWLLVSASGEWLARQVESRLDAHLWRYEEWMQLMSSARYAHDDEERILVIGPSEAREAFWPQPFREVLNGARLVNDSLSLSTFEDAITQLEYIEKVYGRGSAGDLILVAVTPRFLQGYIPPGERPLPIVLDRYSPYYALDETVEPQALVPKNAFASLVSRLRLAGHSGARYTKALRAVLLAARTRASGGDIEAAFRQYSLVGARFYEEGPRDKRQYYDVVKAGSGLNPPLRSMDPYSRRDAIVRDFDRLRAFASRNDARIFVVNLPEGGWARKYFYDPGVAEAYAAVLREAVGELPFLDLREALADDGFVDWVHPTMKASMELSRRVAIQIRFRDTYERVEASH